MVEDVPDAPHQLHGAPVVRVLQRERKPEPGTGQGHPQPHSPCLQHPIHLQLRGVVPQLDLEQETVLAHLVVCLLLQLLDQPLQQLRRLHVLLGVVEVDGVPAHTEQSGAIGAAQHGASQRWVLPSPAPRRDPLPYHAWLSIHCDR